MRRVRRQGDAFGRLDEPVINDELFARKCLAAAKSNH
jgi:hypothetical protein